MKWTRHARNRLRWIERRHPAVTNRRLLEALPVAETLGYDDRGNRRARVMIENTEVTVVVDETEDAVITLWVR